MARRDLDPGFSAGSLPAGIAKAISARKSIDPGFSGDPATLAAVRGRKKKMPALSAKGRRAAVMARLSG